MIDTTQMVIVIVILVLTTMFAVIGVQVYFILREFRTTLQKANKVLGGEALSSLVFGIKRGTAIIKKTRRFLRSGRKL